MITDAVRRQPNGQIMSKKDAEAAVDYWLRKAATRLSKVCLRTTLCAQLSLYFLKIRVRL